jgi:hypothetical protein
MRRYKSLCISRDSLVWPFQPPDEESGATKFTAKHANEDAFEEAFSMEK